LLSAPAQSDTSEPDRLFDTVRAAHGPGPMDDDFSLIILTFA
jgi:hypothetical protein